MIVWGSKKANLVMFCGDIRIYVAEIIAVLNPLELERPAKLVYSKKIFFQGSGKVFYFKWDNGHNIEIFNIFRK